MVLIQYFILSILLFSCAQKNTLISQYEKPSEIELFRLIKKGEKNPYQATFTVGTQGGLHFESGGFPAGKIFHLADEGHLGEIRYLDSYRADKKGNLISLANSQPISAVFIAEGVTQYYLVAEDQSTMLSKRVDSDAIEVKAESGMKLSMSRFDLMGNNYNCLLEGLNPSETFHFRSISGDETMEHTLQVDEQGSLFWKVMPGTISSEGGVAHLELTRNTGEKITIDYPWGTAIGSVKPKTKVD